jgi:starch synthase
LNQHKFSGILNGIDYDVWNPEIDPYIPHHYSISTFEDKALNKKELRERLLLKQCDKPILSFIGRLDDQKGVHLVHHALYYA